MIVLYQYRPAFGLPNSSPYCMKLEMYLRLAKLEYRVETLKGRSKSYTRKAPYIEIDGKFLTDSGLIIDHLERGNGNRLDGRLTLAQRGESLAIQRMMEEHLYFVMLYSRGIDPETEQEADACMRQVMGIPGPLFPIVGRMIKRTIRIRLRNQGIGLHSRETIYQFGIDDIAALSNWLGTRSFSFGDQPTVVDLCIASFIATIVRQPWPNPLTLATSEHANLVAHSERVLTLTFPEMYPAVKAREALHAI
jgi:glutathione S-transferase